MCFALDKVGFLLPELFLCLSACVFLMLGLFIKNISLKAINLLVAAVLTMALYILFYQVPFKEELKVFDSLFKSNMLIINLKSMVLILATAFFLSYKQFANESFEFPVIVLFSIVGMMLMLSANHFLSFYVSLELQSLSLYVLAAYDRESSNSAEAGVKYFVIGSFASGVMLFGISLIYGFTGNLDFDLLTAFLANNEASKVAIAIIIGLVMLLIGLFFKVSAAPFHMWTPDVYQGSPTMVTCFFATAVKIASVGFLYRITSEVLFAWSFNLQPILIFVTCMTLLVGSIGALKQNNIKRLLAYSSIVHVGFLLLGITAFPINNSILMYLVIYVVMTFAVFVIIMSLEKDQKPVLKLEDLKGLAKSHPIIASSLAILMFSLSGIPPFAGFFAKFYVFQEAINAKLYVVSLVAAVSAIIAAYYYLRIVKIMYLDEIKEPLMFNMILQVKAMVLLLVLFNLVYIFI